MIDQIIEFNKTFVAHNARFDEGCLKAAFKVYQMDYPDYRFYDTLTAARRQFGRSLPNHQFHTVAAACGYKVASRGHIHLVELWLKSDIKES